MYLKKIIGFFIMMLLIGTAMPTLGISNNYSNEEINSLDYSHRNSISISQNGIILAQELDENNKGYTIIRVSGSHYEMGYAQAELLGDYIVQGIKEFKDSIGEEDYSLSRDIASGAIWMPTDIEDEINGIVDCLAITRPSENIDDLDIKALQTAGEWWYQGCRGHTCWGRYVTEPIKTLSTQRLDWPAPISGLYHHVLCAHDPNDGSPQWISFGWPGVVAITTGVNEFGIAMRIQDFNSHDLDMTSGRISRGIISRYALTYATSPNVSTHLADVYTELQNYEVMSGGFLTYYAPEGHGGVFTSNPYQSGPDFYHLRTPQESWHHGEAMITTNAWTDGTYTPEDEDFDADLYYDDESPKTLESHWDLLDRSGMGVFNLHMLSIAYRGPSDMTIWAEGKITSLKRTPRLEWEWYDLFNAEPPTIPDISGESKGKKGIEYEYSFSSTDGNGDDIFYYIDWGDDSDEEIIGPESSGNIVTSKHIWVESGGYTIKAKAKDNTGLESKWSILEVSMSKTKAMGDVNRWFLKLIHQFPILEFL